jgi:glycosyltransferase involved in cell wall biosynthesis
VYQRAAAFVLLPQVVRGDVEGFGLVLLEAAASGTPVIVGRGTGADDAVADGKSGYLLDSSNSERVVEKMVELTQADKRLKLARGSVAWAREMSWDQQIKKYVALYQELQG